MYEGALCVCCMSTENLEALFGGEGGGGGGGEGGGGCQDYGAMLVLCLRLPLLESDGHDSICTTCIEKLKDCLEFKTQALRTISLLSLFDIKELIPSDEVQLLEPTRRVESPAIKTPDELEPIADSLEHDELEININNNDEEVNINAHEEKISKNTKQTIANKIQTVTSKESCSQPVAVAVSRRRPGRPRVHSPARMPYRVPDTELRCRECGATFPTNITLKVHYNSHFGRCVCGACGARFMSGASLNKHALSHRAGPFQCPHCKQEFSKLNTLLSHKRYKHSPARGAPYPCRECGVALPTLHARLKHVAAVHRPPARRHACPRAPCPRWFPHAGELAKHIATHHSRRTVSCGECGKSVRATYLQLHRRTHLSPSVRPPRVPGVRTHPAERRFACKLCGNSFTQKKNALYHFGSHERRGDYSGDLTWLLVDRRTLTKKNTGLLSDEEDNLEDEQSDESVLTDEMVGVLDYDDASENHASDEDQPPPDLCDATTDLCDVGDVPTAPSNFTSPQQKEDEPEIRTDFGFSVPSDFDD